MDVQRGNESSRRGWPWGWISAVAGIVAAIAGALLAGWLLLNPMGLTDERAKISAIQVIAALGFGVGGIGTLMLFVRRQWLQEQAHQLDQQKAELDRQIAAENQRDAQLRREHDAEVASDNRHDAQERRITDLYMKAAEQLGHEKASVRLAALYALDRLGRNHEGHRQEVVDIWCAYLRQPFTPPNRLTASKRAANPMVSTPEPVDSTIDVYLTPPAAPETKLDHQEEEAREQEYQVRATAQRLLARHFQDPRTAEEHGDDDERPSPMVVKDGYWGVNRIDLTGATLIDSDLQRCWIPVANFTGAYFHGTASFDDTWFDGAARFDDTWFSGNAGFDGVRFHEEAQFDRARFNGGAQFHTANFHRNVSFRRARFESVGWFDHVRFHRNVWFNSALFNSRGVFDSAHFHWAAMFHHTQFRRDGVFRNVRFHGRARFGRTRFSRNPMFDGAMAVSQRSERRSHAWPRGWGLEPVRDRNGTVGCGKLVRIVHEPPSDTRA